MKCARRCRSTPSSSGDATHSRPATGPWRETATSSRFARRRSWTSWSNTRFGRSAPRRRPADSTGILVGTGIACATKDYGTGGDGTLASVELAPDGRITIHCDYVEMGTGIGTAVANRVAAHLGSVADEIALAQVDTFGPLALVTSGDSYTMEQNTAGRGGAQSTLGACDQYSRHCLDRRSCRHPRGGRGRTRHLPVRSMAGGARIVGYRAERPESQRMEDSAVERRATGDAWTAAARLAGRRREGACAQWRDRGDGAWLQSLGMVAGDLRARRAGMDGRHRCAGGAPGLGRICAHRSFQLKFPPTDFNRIGQSLHVACAARWSASRSIGPPAGCASPRRTASWNAARLWCPRS